MNKITIVSLVAFALIPIANIGHADLADFLKGKSEGMFSGGGEGSARLTDSRIDAGLKEALSIGAERAVSVLGKPGGFLDDPRVRIPLPGPLQKVASAARAVGKGELVDEFETTINRAAEEAIPKTLDIVTDTVKNMTLQDVRGILNGPDDAATQYLRKNSWSSMHRAVKPIVMRATDSTGATRAYKNLTASSGGSLGSLGGFLGGGSDALDLDKYATDKTLDGLFLMLAEEEKKIRENPLARSTDLLKSVFR